MLGSTLRFDVAIETGKWLHLDPSTVIDEREIITICVSYPLRHPTIINMQSVGGWTAKAFADAVCDIYRNIGNYIFDGPIGEIGLRA
jgi:hypothetical protein